MHLIGNFLDIAMIINEFLSLLEGQRTLQLFLKINLADLAVTIRHQIYAMSCSYDKVRRFYPIRLQTRDLYHLIDILNIFQVYYQLRIVI